MTDKQEIIIDGVDVSGCHHLDIGFQGMWLDSPECDLDSYECELNPNCYFKQLQRTQIQYNKIVEQNKSIQQELQRKIEECEEREKDAENWAYKAGLAEGAKSRYKQALDEIEGMVQTIMETNKIYPLQANLGKILDIISEAKGGE